ncbi:AGD14 [Symbiodinium pilosum]|uniref:AGD14 protein n=1 Tax=Symbiodinium pilosum TaxID=2952 RepID=A0A812W157_SYMPI|nr:AGD14 [Symbiodinium pilosum]
MQHLQLIRTKSLRPVETPHPSRLHVLHVSAFQLVITQEEVVHVPKVMEQEPATNFHVEEWVDIPIKSRVEKIVHIPIIREEQRLIQNPLEVVVEVAQPQVVVKVVEVPKITVEEKIIKVPKITRTVVDTAAWLHWHSITKQRYST